MGLTKAEALSRHSDKVKEAQDLEDERNGTALPANTCPHSASSLVRGVIYKGPKPMQVTYCEACGALGPAGGSPTLATWVSPLTFKR